MRHQDEIWGSHCYYYHVVVEVLGFGAMCICRSIPTFRTFSHSTPSPLPVTFLKVPFWSTSSSHIPSLWLATCPQPLLFMSYITTLLPCLVTSAPEDGDRKFLRNVSIDLQIHTALKTSTATWLGIKFIQDMWRGWKKFHGWNEVC
jgi:hypothetical protein